MTHRPMIWNANKGKYRFELHRRGHSFKLIIHLNRFHCQCDWAGKYPGPEIIGENILALGDRPIFSRLTDGEKASTMYNPLMDDYMLQLDGNDRLQRVLIARRIN